HSNLASLGRGARAHVLVSDTVPWESRDRRGTGAIVVVKPWRTCHRRPRPGVGHGYGSVTFLPERASWDQSVSGLGSPSLECARRTPPRAGQGDACGVRPEGPPGSPLAPSTCANSRSESARL